MVALRPRFSSPDKVRWINTFSKIGLAEYSPEKAGGGGPSPSQSTGASTAMNLLGLPAGPWGFLAASGEKRRVMLSGGVKCDPRYSIYSIKNGGEKRAGRNLRVRWPKTNTLDA